MAGRRGLLPFATLNVYLTLTVVLQCVAMTTHLSPPLLDASTPAADPESWLSPSDVSRMLQVGKPLVYAWISRGRLPAVDFGSGDGRPTYKVRRKDFDAFLASRQTGGAS